MELDQELSGSVSSEYEKLTDWKNEPSLMILKGDYEAAKPYHDSHMQEIKDWNDLLNVKNKHKPKQFKNRSSIQPKIIRRQAEWRYSALTEPFLGNEKLFDVTPATFEDTEAAKQNELVLNWQVRTKIKRVKFIDDYIRSAVDEGVAIIRTGWLRETAIAEEEAPVFEYYPVEDEEDLQLLQEAIEAKHSNPRGFEEGYEESVKAAVAHTEETGMPVVAVEVGVEIVEVEKIVENKPTVEVLDPNNVLVDPSCNGDIDNAKFVICSFETCKADLEKQGDIYTNLDKVLWDTESPGTQYNHQTSTPNSFQFKDTARKKVVAFEYWGYYDVHGDGKLTAFVATWIGNVLIRMEENPFPDEKPPFILVQYLPRKRELYGETDASLLEDNQKIYGATMRGVIDSFGRSANAQIGFMKGLLDPLNKRKYDQGADYEFNPTNHPTNGIYEHKFPEIPQSVLTLLNLQNSEAEALTGVKSFTGGISGDSYGKVATGIRGALDAASKREMAILRRLAEGIVSLGQKMIAMNSAFMSEEEVVRVTNKEFVVIRREDLAGNFDLKVDISTAEIDEAKANDLSFMVQTVGPQTSPDIVLMLMAEIADLKRMPELAEKLRNYDTSPSPEQQRMQELELELKEVELELRKSEVELNIARAKKESSIADKTDLDYVEQETGTAHEREMAKQKAQSQGNQDLAITKALASPKKPEEIEPNIDAAVGHSLMSSAKDAAMNPLDRDLRSMENPELNLGSSKFDPRMDPSLNPNLNI